jgi:hypothetical protein
MSESLAQHTNGTVNKMIGQRSAKKKSKIVALIAVVGFLAAVWDALPKPRHKS